MFAYTSQDSFTPVQNRFNQIAGLLLGRKCVAALIRPFATMAQFALIPTLLLSSLTSPHPLRTRVCPDRARSICSRRAPENRSAASSLQCRLSARIQPRTHQDNMRHRSTRFPEAGALPQPDTRQALKVGTVHMILRCLPIISLGFGSPSIYWRKAFLPGKRAESPSCCSMRSN